MMESTLMHCVFPLFFLPVLASGFQQQEVSGLVAAVQGYTRKTGEHDTPRFKHALADLNNDGVIDAIVLLLDPTWCGSGGCTALIFRGTKTGFTFISESTITNEPIRVLRERALGWRTLIVYSKGKGDVLMCFDGKRYPLNPSTQPKATSAQLNDAQIVMK
jgi:hypothetical protein